MGLKSILQCNITYCVQVIILGRNHHHWITIGDPVDVSLETPRFWLETPTFSWETPIFSLETPRCSLETPFFHWRHLDSRWRPLILSLENPRFLVETPIFSMETPIFFWKHQDSRWRPPYFYWRPQIFIGDPIF